MKKIVYFLYPFLLAVYPILALRNNNITYVDTASIVRSLVLALILTGLLWVLFRIILRDWDRAGIIASVVMLLFFLYGHTYIQIEQLFGSFIRHRYLLIIFGVVVLLVIWWVSRKLKDPRPVMNALVTMGAVLLSFLLIQSIGRDFSSLSRNVKKNSPQELGVNSNNGETRELPDVYWILLDAHTRSDILLEHFDHDNSSFIKELEDMGFFVGDCSQSNYPSTRYSVTSVMNANYLDRIPGVTSGIPALKDSLVVQTLRSLGYTVISFENRSTGHFELKEDIRLSRNQLALGNVDLFGGVNEFEAELIQTSILRLVFDMPQLIPGLDPTVVVKLEYYEHYLQTQFILEKLPDLPEAPGPKFVFVHVMVPHDPYIFTPEGEFHWAENQTIGYRSNVAFIDSHITPVVEKIIERSKTPPIIIIQGDHGPSGKKVTPHMRMSILNAYYVNDETRADLYDTITPVNSFRVIFNHYFGTDYPLLEDSSYLAYGEGQFKEDRIIPNTCVSP